MATPDRARVVSTGGGATISNVTIAGASTYIETLLKMPTLSDVSDRISVRVCGTDNTASADETNAVYFEFDPQNHGGSNNWFGCNADGGVRNKVDLGIGPTANVWQKLRCEVRSGALESRFLVDDALVGVNPTNLPLGGFGIIAQVIKTLGVNPLAVHIDYVQLAQVFTAAR